MLSTRIIDCFIRVYFHSNIQRNAPLVVFCFCRACAFQFENTKNLLYGMLASCLVVLVSWLIFAGLRYA